MFKLIFGYDAEINAQRAHPNNALSESSRPGPTTYLRIARHFFLDSRGN